MNTFVARHAEKVIGVLSGFDRLVLRGTLRRIVYADGLAGFLSRHGVLLKDFGDYAERLTLRLKQASLGVAQFFRRPVTYLESSATSKEYVARRVLSQDPVKSGLICVLSAVEPCQTFEIHRSRERKRLELRSRRRKCLFLYHYFLDPVFGFMSARIQTWLPFSIQICINGREWLARLLDRSRLSYERRDNCFLRIPDIDRAQRLMDQSLSISWPSELNRIAGWLNPAHGLLFEDEPLHYYWSVYQSEWATDVMFHDPKTLAHAYGPITRYAISSFSTRDVMRFLGRAPHPNFKGQVVSSFQHRPEGLRVKHSVGWNSVKLYDKQGSVLRVETTINEPRDFRVYRRKEGDPGGKMDWLPLRKGIADLQRRARVSQASNDRYLEALSTVDDPTTIKELTERVCRRTNFKGRPVRPLRPFEKSDSDLMEVVCRGEFAVNGLRNRDVTRILFATQTKCEKEKRRRSARVTRLLRMLRAHGLIKKVAHTHRYIVTEYGRKVMGALLAAREATLADLNKAA